MNEEVVKETNTDTTTRRFYSDPLFSSVLQVKMISHGTGGGRKFRYHALVVVGDNEAKVGIAIAKASTVRAAIEKSMSQAKKHMVTFSFGNAVSIPFEIIGSYHSTKVIMKPAKEGHGLISGGVARSVLEAIGIRNVCCKVHGSRHRNSVLYATMDAMKRIEEYKHAFDARNA